MDIDDTPLTRGNRCLYSVVRSKNKLCYRPIKFHYTQMMVSSDTVVVDSTCYSLSTYTVKFCSDRVYYRDSSETVD